MAHMEQDDVLFLGQSMLCMECNLIRFNYKKRNSYGLGFRRLVQGLPDTKTRRSPPIRGTFVGVPIFKDYGILGFISGPEECDAGGSIGRNPADE